MDKIQRIAKALGLPIEGLLPDQARELVINEVTQIVGDQVEALNKASIAGESDAAAGAVHEMLPWIGALLCQAGEHDHEKIMFSAAKAMEDLEIERSLGDAITLVLDGEVH